MDNTFCTKTANHTNGEYHQITRAFTYFQVRAYDAALSYFEYQREHNADLGELALANLLRNLSRYGFRIRIDTFYHVRAKGQHKDLAQTCAYDFMKKGLPISILMLLMSIQRETVCSRKNQQNANFTISVLYFFMMLLFFCGRCDRETLEPSTDRGRRFKVVCDHTLEKYRPETLQQEVLVALVSGIANTPNWRTGLGQTKLQLIWHRIYQ